VEIVGPGERWNNRSRIKVERLMLEMRDTADRTMNAAMARAERFINGGCTIECGRRRLEKAC
jgi:hypothetical protein